MFPLALLALLACSAQAGEAQDRERMVREQIAARGITDPGVLEAMRRVPRHLFVPLAVRGQAYADHPLPIGHDQTISQPYVVAYMTAALQVGPGDKVLEVGTGSGYQAAVLAALGAEVFSIEIIDALARDAARNLAATGFDAVHLRTGDGYRGWPEAAPFDGIVVTAAPDHVPPPLQEQLALGGRLVIPVGKQGAQDLMIVTRSGEAAWTRERVMGVLFVPMTGEAER